MGADGIVSEEFASIGGPGVEGTLMTFPPDPRKRPEAAAIVKEQDRRLPPLPIVQGARSTRCLVPRHFDL
jgi:hypothetical protein